MSDRKSYGRALRNHREKSDLTMGDLADALGISVNYVSDVERGEIQVEDSRFLYMHSKVYELWESNNPPKDLGGEEEPILEFGDTCDDCREKLGTPHQRRCKWNASQESHHPPTNVIQANCITGSRLYGRRGGG